MSDSPAAGVPKFRPSFTGYWKRSKDQQAGKNLTFVTSKLSQSSAHGEHEAQAEPSAEAKARARRQQVRKAQLQHRQRKANYTKQLEMDVTKLRDDIAKVEQEITSLKKQNNGIRSRLACGDEAVLPVALNVSPADTMDMAFSTCLAPNYTVSLDMLDYLDTPAFQVRRASPSLLDTGARATSSHATETLRGATPISAVSTNLEDDTTTEMALSEEQTDQAINFILALEHCCWDHIDQSCFERHDHHSSKQQPQPQPQPRPRPPHCPLVTAMHATTATDDDEEDAEEINEHLENGHTLTATALALQSAPYNIFTQISDMQQPLSSSSTPTPTPVTFPCQTLTLTNLRRLARTLNPSDTELAPVQVWFELASLYGVAVATDKDVLENLKRELAGEMRCVTFGAAVQRDVFEGVLDKVMGFLPRSWERCEGMGDEEEEEEEGEESTSAVKPKFFKRLMHTAKGGGSGH
ncbi:hypothetical protein HD806DRAFT_269239 [Xylariaceae sp. AK1471]|nr:hypothetical protein HD806DRAFT_269239 [Xylariaceae sp. AK1471]